MTANAGTPQCGWPCFSCGSDYTLECPRSPSSLSVWQCGSGRVCQTLPSVRAVTDHCQRTSLDAVKRSIQHCTWSTAVAHSAGRISYRLPPRNYADDNVWSFPLGFNLSCGSGCHDACFRRGIAAEPGPISDDLREAWKLDRFYQKQTDATGLLVVGSRAVSDYALAEAAWIVARMLDGRADILKAMSDNRVRIVVMAATEYTTDVPEHAELKPELFWDHRRGDWARRW